MTYEKQSMAVTKQTVSVEAYRKWGCYTSQANGAMHQKAKRFLAKMERLQNKNGDFAKYYNAFKAFVKSYRNFQYTDTGISGGAGDTAVREVIWDFLCKTAKAVGFDESILDEVWEKYYD